MNSQLMEFFGNYLIQAARWQKLVEQFSPDIKPDVKDMVELGRLFQKACGIDGPAEPAFEENSRIWQQAVESFQSVFCSYATMWGWIPQADYQVLQEKCDAFERKIRERSPMNENNPDATGSEAMESLLKGAGAMPELLATMARNTVDGYNQLQQKWLERCGRIGETVDAYSFERLDENMFRTWIDMYETEFQQFFNIPQLGLARGYQEKFNQAMDKYNIYQSTLAEFVRVLSLPLSHSVAVMQEKLGEMTEKGALPDDSRKYYQIWIKILEGHYMKLFQSPEYNQILANTLNAVSDFSASRDAVIQDMLSVLPIPGRKEIDDLERELYELKKRIQVLEKNHEPLARLNHANPSTRG